MGALVLDVLNPLYEKNPEVKPMDTTTRTKSRSRYRERTPTPCHAPATIASRYLYDNPRADGYSSNGSDDRRATV